MSGKFGSGWGRVRERTRIGIQSSECLGLMLGHPFLEKFGYKSGRQMCGPCPPPPLHRWAVNTAVSQETGPNILAPHSYLYQDSLSFSGLVWPLNPLLS